jgi:hypothetical protein
MPSKLKSHVAEVHHGSPCLFFLLFSAFLFLVG